MLYYAQVGDPDGMHRCLKNGVDIDCMDQYQWTPLMIAVFSRHLNCVKMLVDCGSDKTLKNSQGSTAKELAVQTGNGHIVAALKRKQRFDIKPDEDDDDLTPPAANEDSYTCSICNEVILLSHKMDHDTSVHHLLNEGHDPKPDFIVPETNKGYQIMIKRGWGKLGLGSEESGRLYPIQTTLKRDRHCLGSEPGQHDKKKKKKNKARVTHFKANDTAAVADFKEPLPVPDKTTLKEIKEKKEKEKQFEVGFRKYWTINLPGDQQQ